MEVKGSAIESIPAFVKTNFPDRYGEWLNSLPPKSKEVFSKPIIAAAWYPLKEALVIPTEKICDLFYDGNLRGAWELGRFSAEYGLKSVYKLILEVLSPKFLASRAPSIFSTYYRPAKMILVEFEEDRQDIAVLRIVEFSEPSLVVEMRVGGWIERAVELAGGKEVKVEITKSMAKGDKYTEFIVTWK